MALPLSTTSTLLLPSARASRSLASDIAALRSRLAAHLRAPAFVALWRLPSHVSLPLSLALLSLGHTPVWLNARWTLREAAAAVRALPVVLLLLPPDPPPRHPHPNHPRTTHDLPHLPPRVARLRVSRDPRHQLVVSPAPPAAVPAAASPPAAPPPSPPPPPPPSRRSTPPDSVFFTSGTTATSKAVLLPWCALHVQAAAKLQAVGYGPHTVYLHLSPLFHVGGFSSALAVALAGAAHVFPRDTLHLSRLRDAQEVLGIVRRHAVNTLVLVPAAVQLLLDAAPPVQEAEPEVAPPLSSVQTLLYGAARLSRRQRRGVARVFPNASIVGAYGMTEAASSITFLRHADFPDASPLHESAGWAAEHVELRVVPREGAGGVGEVQTRGPHVMRGYFGGAGVGEGGWFATGDLGYLQQGTGALFLVGRAKDMIKSAGENVFAGEVEDALEMCEDVREAAVVGIPHRVLGEAVAAAVVLVADGEKPFEEILGSIEEACRQCLSPFKIPKWILKQDELPRTTTGKVLKELLKTRLANQVYRPLAKL